MRTRFAGIIETSKWLKEMRTLKQQPSIYRHDRSDPDLNPIFFAFGFIFAILGALFAGFQYSHQTSNATATWYGVGCGLIVKYLAALPYIIFFTKHGFHGLF